MMNHCCIARGFGTRRKMLRQAIVRLRYLALDPFAFKIAGVFYGARFLRAATPILFIPNELYHQLFDRATALSGAGPRCMVGVEALRPCGRT